QEAGNELRMRHGRQPWPAPPPMAFPKFCLAEDPDGLWVAEHGDAIVGFGFSWMAEKFWCLSQLFVRPKTQAKGIGQALLSKTLVQAERSGATNRALITRLPTTFASTGLYLNNGLFRASRSTAWPRRRRLSRETSQMPGMTRCRLRPGLSPLSGPA